MPATVRRLASSALKRRFKPLALNPFLQWMPPGHFYSPIPSAQDCARRCADREVAGIDLRLDEQRALAHRLARYMPPPFGPTAGSARFGWDNNYYGVTDGTVLYALLEQLRPSRIIEVGSGFSTAVMLDTIDRWSEKPALTCIEPFPDRLRTQLRTGDRVEILECPVQDVPLARFAELRAGDVLFIDSSHVLKVGSDVQWLLRYVLPNLPRGVWIHIHDLFWPFEYPEEWIAEGRGWTEAYALHAFLQFNETFAIRWFTSYLYQHERGLLRETLPLALEQHGGSLWLEKVR
jgi:predicted O-methyltransferase YrrM